MGALGLLLVLHTRDVTGAHAAGGAVAAAYAAAWAHPTRRRGFADRRGQVRLLRIGGPLSAAAIAGQAVLADGGRRSPPDRPAAVPRRRAAADRRVPPALVERPLGGRGPPSPRVRDGGRSCSRSSTCSGGRDVGGIGTWSIPAALLFCATVTVAGDLAFAEHPAVRSLAGEPSERRDLVGALRAPGVVVALATLLHPRGGRCAAEVGIPRRWRRWAIAR